MRKAVALFIFILASSAAYAQTGALEGFCNQGGTNATVSGLKSSNYQQGNIPSCTITVYLTGTTTLATIYKDKNNTPLGNPFTADVVGSVFPGHWLFFESTSQAVDVVGSGGISPNTYASPVPLCTDCYPSSQIVSQMNLQHNSSATNIDQSLFNLCDNGTCGTSLPANMQQVYAGPDSTGGWNFWTANASAQFQAAQNAPSTAQHVIVYPTSYTVSSCSPGTATGTNTGGVAYNPPPSGASCDSVVTWHFTAPTNPAIGNITAVYPFLITNGWIESGSTGSNFIVTHCTGAGVTDPGTTITGPSSAAASYPSQQRTSSTSLTVSTANFNAMTCSITASVFEGIITPPNGDQITATLVGAYVYYTGAPVATPTYLNIQYPLLFDPTSNTLSLDVPYDTQVDTGAANAYIVTDGAFTKQTTGLEVGFMALNASTSTAPTLNVNGWGAWPIVGPTGAALVSGDIKAYASTGYVARVRLGSGGGNQNQWWLENPQVSGAGGVSSVSNSDGSLSISPTTGAVVGSINYAHAGTWTALETFSAGLSANAMTLSAITGSTQCLHVNASGVVSGTGSDCGSTGGSVSVNGAGVTNPNFNGTTPAAPSGNTNGTFQVSGSNVSVYFPNVVSTYPAINVQNAPYNAKGDGKIASDGSMGATIPAPGSSANSTPATAPSLTTNFANDVVVSLFYTFGSTAAAPSAGTVRLNNTSGSGVQVLVSDQTVAAAGTVPAVTSALTGSDQWYGASLSLVPTSGNTISYVSNNFADNGGTTSFLTINKPTGAAAGDVEIAFIYYYNPTQTVTFPAQFPNNTWSVIPITSWAGTANNTILVMTHVVTASDPSSYTWTFSANMTGKGIILDYRNVGGIDNPITQTLWVASHGYSDYRMQIRDTNGCLEQVSTKGTSGGSQPTWPACTAGNVGVTTTDNTMVWTNRGTAPSFAAGDVGKLLCVDGSGTSGHDGGCGTVGGQISATEILPLSFANVSGGAIDNKEYRYATDDTAALQSAINAAPATIVIPQGNYGVSSSLTFTAGVPFVLTGVSSAYPNDPDALVNGYLEGIDNAKLGSSVWFLSNQLSGAAALLFNAGAVQNSSGSPQKVSNLGILAGVGTSFAGGGSDGIDIVNWNSLTIDNVAVDNFSGNGILVDSTTAGSTYSELDNILRSSVTHSGQNGIQIGSGTSIKYIDVINILQNQLSYNKLSALATAGYVNILTVDQNKLNANQQGNTGLEVNFGGGGPSALHMTGNYFEAGCDGDTATGYFNITQRMSGSATIYPNYFSTICATVAVPVPVFSAAGVPLNPAGNQNAHGYACVSDASVACTVGQPYAGSGTNKCQVQSDGTNWRYTGAQCF